MKTKHRILSVLTILALVASLSAVMVSPVAADIGDPGAGEFAKYPHSGAVGSVVEVRVGENNALEDQIIRVYYGGVQVSTTPEAPKVRAEGEGDTVLHFAVPASTKGDHTIAVKVGIVEMTGDTDADKTFTVRPRVDISPLEGPKGSAATATVTGFAANVSVDVFAGNNRVGSGETDSKGSAVVALTMDYAGLITARDGAGNTSEVHPDTFAFAPGITLDPTSGPVGRTITVEGSGLDNDKYYALAIANVPTELNVVTGTEHDYTVTDWPEPPGTNIKRVEPTARGEIEVTIVIPEGMSPGIKVVQLRDVTGVTNERLAGYLGREVVATAKLHVTAAVFTLTPDEGPVGTTVTASGTQLAPDADIEVWFDKDGDDVEDANEVMETAKTDADGAFTLTFEVPSVRAGTFDVYVNVEGIVAGNTSFKVPAAEIDISPEEGVAGTLVTVVGKGFTPFSPVIIFEDEDEDGTLDVGDDANLTPTPAVLTDAWGNFTATFVMPGLPIKVHQITVTAGDLTADADFELIRPAVAVMDGLRGIEAVLAESVWFFDNVTKTWTQYLVADPLAVPEAYRLDSLEEDQPYWLYVTADTTLVFGGESYTLTAGWNLIAWRG
ncbi:transthyretin-like family protein [Dehalococcoidia bacterium]|nr:transthyretin-like family protein [Dehalococcoidia bacterium]